MSSTEISLEVCKIPNVEVNTHDYDTKSNYGFTYDFKWEGVVLHIGNDTITARIIESTTNEEDELTLPLSKISSDDIELLDIGALFNFYVGYTNSNGTLRNSDVIKFRRKAIVQDDINDILDSMKEINFEDLLEDY